ncbi:zinc-binding alcohol dehydrogenase family protein [Niabella beijingensis]|uniref:zinc-binding alcohol dehydrogenase family protein n=1 Tax=Niabella beijingensis TaxID=2872700 RepID=UPI001CC05B4E|nr:zinc-binding alcohol dehydrogenase family protein [Niabella beijingensis]MBZ4189179.1 zinc-binding alcohol dehydrogenase family protein [Niabella beijingensis]
MKTLVCTAPGHFEFREDPIPEAGAGRARIRLKRVGICGTDLHAFEGTQPFFSYPRILGHELSGELIDAGGAAGFEPGELVTIIPYFSCGTCIACRAGKPNCCVAINVFGVHVDGGMREEIVVPTSSLLHGQGLNADELALVEPLAIGAHGVRRAGVQPGEYVLVIGAGPIGLGTMELARIAGAQVIALDINTDRLRFCREKLGVHSVVNGADSDAVEQVKAITNGDFPTVVIDATGNLRAINNGIQYLAHGGRYVLIGLQKEAFSFSHPEFHKRETTLMSSRNAVKEDFEHVIRSMKAGAIRPQTYITHMVDFDEVPAQFASWLNPATGVIKAMVHF